MTPTSETPPPGDDRTEGAETFTPGETAFIQHLTRRIVLAAAEHRYGDVLHHGDTIALQYGPEGEWLLAATLATYARHTPLCQAVPPGDGEAPALLQTLARRHWDTTPAQRAQAINDARKHAHRFTQAHAHGNSARTAWNAVYRTKQPCQPPTLAALACTTLLILWAAHSLTSHTAFRQS